jgi:hypothetical protein
MHKKTILLFLLLAIGQAKAQEKSTDFKRCGDQKLWPYYYQTKDGYTPDFYEVKKAFAQQYKSQDYQNLPDNSGIFHVVFWVNCEGKAGNYSYETFNHQYQYAALNPKICEDLLRITQSLKVWQAIPAKNEVQNFHQYFIFRITNGRITDILPK